MLQVKVSWLVSLTVCWAKRLALLEVLVLEECKAQPRNQVIVVNSKFGSLVPGCVSYTGQESDRPWQMTEQNGFKRTQLLLHHSSRASVKFCLFLVKLHCWDFSDIWVLILCWKCWFIFQLQNSFLFLLDALLLQRRCCSLGLGWS